jgi:cystathionine gamma-synthase
MSKLATIAVRTGIERDTQHGAVIPPLHLSSNYTFEKFGIPRQYDYTRSGNPTRSLLAETLAELEGGELGVVTASGMAAITTVLQLLQPGDRIVVPHDCYGGTWRLIDAWQKRGQFEVDWVDLTDPKTRQSALSKPAKLIWVETPSNPLLRITDIAAIRAQAPDAILVVDNTFLSPALQRPFEFGADIVVHSTTKYINGHSDVVGGAVIAKNRALGEELAWWANCLGLTGAPFDAWLTLRGVRTLKARMTHHLQNANAVVEVLQSHSSIAAVYYPGLTTHPGHSVAHKQQRGFGAMVSFELRTDVNSNAVPDFIASLNQFSLAESLGGVESLIAHPATMTHAAMSKEARKVAGISEDLLRMSIGIEDPEDLCNDLKRALDICAAPLAKGAVR